MPALAFGTPVLRIIKAEDDGRYAGYENFFHSASYEEIIKNKDIYDFDNPPANPENHIQMRDELIKKCTEFTGYDCNESFIREDINPLIEIINASRHDYFLVRRLLFKASPKHLIKTFLAKTLLKKDIHSRKERRTNFD